MRAATATTARSPWFRRLPRRRWIAALALLIGTVAAVPAWALQREIKSKARNYPNAPVVIKQSRVTLREQFSTPTQLAFAGSNARPSRIPYANRKGQLPSTFALEGEVSYRNASPHAVEALGLTVILLDAFHQPLPSTGAKSYTIHQITAPLPIRAERSFRWEQLLSSLDVYEVAVVITRVRFADGTVWLAPEEELIDVFE